MRLIRFMGAAELRKHDAVPVGRCEDCARNADNGGLYDDGRTRCPIQEHYYLPRDGFCHLWEKRKDGEQHGE